MNVAIVGFGVEGESALTYWQNKGADITVCDADPQKKVPQGVKTQLGADYLHNLSRFDVIIRTVGMHPKKILDKNPGVQDKITTNIDEFLRVCPTKNVIGVTGTKGKGTTSTLIVKMLEAAGKQVFLGGNYGIPAFSFLPQLTEDSWVVLELSSFMLFDVRRSPHIAVCLMIMPEHLDWHDDAEDYFRAKANLFAHQSPQDIAIYFADNLDSHKIASHSPGRKITYYAPPGAYVENGNIMIDATVLCKTDELKLLGKHNWQNVCAAVTAVWQVGQVPDAIRTVLTTFTGLEHRLEFVRELDGVKYYDDSFGTTPETAQVAVEAFSEPKVLILGGSDKGST
jgi:UDP-N-acetylmuramoylalanine--D-glutamate ligase